MRLFQKYYIDEQAGSGGGDPKAPSAPKGYSVTTPQQRTEWNGFLDYLNKQGVAGKPDLDATGAGIKYFQQYKKANPDISLTPEHIQNIQYEQYLLRKGDQFGTLNKMQLEHLRSGLAPGYLNRPVSDVNGQINATTSKLYYPSGQSYGTDIEHYDAALAQPAAATPPVEPAVAPAPTKKKSASPAAAAASGGPVPLPDYNDPKSRAAYLAQFPAKYGAFVHGRGDSIVRINEVPVYGNISAKDAAVQAAKKQGLDPALLYSSTMEEGASGLYPDKKGKVSTGEETNDKYPVSGYANYGLDNFHDDFKEMVKKGYLPKDFDYQKTSTTNEHKAPVNSGLFKNTEDAMQAKAAYVHLYQDRIDDYLKKTGVEMSPRAKQFFTLIGFNGGEGTAHKLIKYYQENGLLNGDKFLKSPPPKSVDPGGAFGHVLPRLQMADLLKNEKLFD